MLGIRAVRKTVEPDTPIFYVELLAHTNEGLFWFLAGSSSYVADVFGKVSKSALPVLFEVYGTCE